MVQPGAALAVQPGLELLLVVVGAVDPWESDRLGRTALLAYCILASPLEALTVAELRFSLAPVLLPQLCGWRGASGLRCCGAAKWGEFSAGASVSAWIWFGVAACPGRASMAVPTGAADASFPAGQASTNPVHVTIVGGGAAGLTAAFFAAEHGAKVTVLERTREAGKKILMSGGSRCNVLPLEVDLATDYFSDSAPSAVRAVFASWNLDLCKAWLEDPYWGVGVDMTLEEETKKWFPTSNSSKEVVGWLSGALQVRDRLVAACEARGVQFIYNASVEGFVAAAAAAPKRSKKGKGKGQGAVAAAAGDAQPPPPTKWLCRLRDGTEHITDKLIVATGGLSFPAVGTDGTGHRLLARLGHSLRPSYAALTPLVGKHPAGQQLAGVSMYDIELSVQLPGAKKPRVSERTALLFTHKGYSGPAVLDLSHHAAGSTALVPNQLQRHGLKERLAEALAAELGLTARRVCDLRKQERAALVAALTAYELQYTGHEGYKKAEVTGGGVPLEEINCATMESRMLPGLFLCGECVDVFGRIGGFNFYWAWVSGRLAGVGAAQGGLHPQRRAKKQAAAAVA
eukprot:XP_001694441.1 predicted protein [Chlamydomonas reinhardtii]